MHQDPLARSGQGPVSRATVDTSAHPRFVNAGNGEAITDPTAISGILAYRLRDNSPLIDAGLNLATLYSINPGTRDFLGNTIPLGTAYDIGACEYRGTTPALA